MTDITSQTAGRPVPGTTLHWVKSGVNFLISDVGLSGLDAVSQRSQTFTLTDAMLEANRDRLGHCLFEIAHDLDAQVERYGEVLLEVGPAPDDMTGWTPGSVEEADARQEHRRLAYAEPDERKRRAALRKVDELFGPAPSSQQSSWTPDDLTRNEILAREGRR